MKYFKFFLKSIVVIFLLYTLYLIIIVYVLNVASLDSHHIIHSESEKSSKNKGFYISSYSYDSSSINHNLVDSLIPQKIFIEKEMINYEMYYFYWGKTVKGNRTSMNGDVFLTLSNSGEYDIVCPTSTQPSESENIDKYREGIYFFFEKTPSEIKFFIIDKARKNEPDTLIYKKI